MSCDNCKRADNYAIEFENRYDEAVKEICNLKTHIRQLESINQNLQDIIKRYESIIPDPLQGKKEKCCLIYCFHLIN
jgi:hypothetical protein